MQPLFLYQVGILAGSAEGQELGSRLLAEEVCVTLQEPLPSSQRNCTFMNSASVLVSGWDPGGECGGSGAGLPPPGGGGLRHLAGAPSLFANLEGGQQLVRTGCRTPPPPLRVAKAGRNHLNEEITPLLPTGIGERYSQTISNLGHVALLH